MKGAKVASNPMDGADLLMWSAYLLDQWSKWSERAPGMLPDAKSERYSRGVVAWLSHPAREVVARFRQRKEEL